MNAPSSSRDQVVFIIGIVGSIVTVITASYHGRVWMFVLLGFGFATYFLWRWIGQSNELRRANGPSPLLNPISSFLIGESIGQRLSETQQYTRDTLGLASFALVQWEQLGTGIWAKSYLFRLWRSGSRPPLSGGSFTGTYITAYAILCAWRDRRHDLGFLTRCLATINGLRSPDGTYRRLRRPSTGGGEQFDLESPRHAAGALLTRLLLTTSDDVDAKTVDWLCDQTPSGAFDAAFVARGLRAWSPQSPRTIERATMLLKTLSPPEDQAPIEYWRQGNAPVSDNTYQWCVVWTFMPFLRDKAFPPDIVDELRTATRRMINEFLNLAPEPHMLLPSGNDGNNVPSGESVLGTSIALSTSLVCGWREECQCLVAKLLFPRSYDLISLPTVPRTGALDVEMYLSWGALLHTTALLGYGLKEEQVEKVKHILGDWRKLQIHGSLDETVLRSHLDGLPEECIAKIHHAAQAVQDVYWKVDEEMRV
jgi:hypothetical protein